MNNWTRPNRPELDATKIPSAIDIAWSAGIYEGEGTCRLCGHTKRGFMVSLPQKDPELLYWLRDWFGGSIRGESKSGCHTWEICGDRARIFIALIYGFLTARRKTQVDATNALEFLQGKSTNGLSMDFLKNCLLSFYEEERERRSSPSAKARRTQRSEYYQRKASDPTWVKTKNEKARTDWKNRKEQRQAQEQNIVAIA
jgi:hypothetical protein